MTDNTQELDDILFDLCDLSYASFPTQEEANRVADQLDYDRAEAKQALIDWHNKQVEEVIKKPHILPKNAYHLESVKQGINFYHRQMRKRVDKLKESK